MEDPCSFDPDAPAGWGGPGIFRSALALGGYPSWSLWKGPYPCGSTLSLLTPHSSVASLTPVAEPAPDAKIEELQLSGIAKKAAYKLKQKHPSVIFTSGRRDKHAQASAMASNVVFNREWIKETYKKTAARDACQKWVDSHPAETTRKGIAAGLAGVLDNLPDAQLAQLSKHLSGDAFDVQPVKQDAEAIKKTIDTLVKKYGRKGIGKFLSKEGGLVRWHAQF